MTNAGTEPGSSRREPTAGIREWSGSERVLPVARAASRFGLAAATLGLSLVGLAARAYAQADPPRTQEAAPAASAMDSKETSGFYFESFPEFSTGTYGTSSRSNTFYLPFTLGYDRNSIVASVTVPVVVVESAGTVTFVGGKPTVISKTRKAGSKATVEGGLGDVMLDAGYYVLEEEPDKRPYVLLEGEVKAPTASKSNGLGTGKFDEELLGTVGMTFKEHWKAEARLGYGFIGQPSNVPETYRDTLYWGVGAGYSFNAKNELWARLEGNSPAVVAGTPAPVTLLFEYDHFAAKTRFYAQTGFGLSSGSPDFLLALGFRIDF